MRMRDIDMATILRKTVGHLPWVLNDGGTRTDRKDGNERADLHHSIHGRNS